MQKIEEAVAKTLGGKKDVVKNSQALVATCLSVPGSLTKKTFFVLKTTLIIKSAAKVLKV